MSEIFLNINFYPAKLLLLGEYTVIDNSMALAVPYSTLKGKWEKKPGFSEKSALNSNQSIQKLTSFLQHTNNNIIAGLEIDFDYLNSELAEGLWFNSEIPEGYGLGSSGALCAGLYDKFAQKKSVKTENIMLDLAEIERFFHGQSSGIDPLVSYLKKTIVIDTERNIKVLDDFNFENFQGAGAVFVLDTNISRSTTHLVGYYKSLKDQFYFRNEFINPLKQLVSDAVEQLLENTKQGNNDFLTIVKEISKLQFLHLEKLIPGDFQYIWKKGLNSNDFYLKLCGAGGGGFILGVTGDWQKTSDLLAPYTITKVFEL